MRFELTCLAAALLFLWPSDAQASKISAMRTTCHVGTAPTPAGTMPTKVSGVLVVSPAEAKCALDHFPDIVLIAAMRDRRQIPGASSVVSLGAAPDDHINDARIVAAMNKLTSGDVDRPVMVYCHHTSCQFSYNAALRLRQLGYTQILWMREGIDGWMKSGFKLVEAGEARVPIDGEPAAFELDYDRFEPIPLGRHIRVSDQMISEHDSDDFLNRYHTIIALQGNRGDRFRIDYRGKEPTTFSKDDDDALELDYIEGAKIDDLSGSVTVTVKIPGVHEIALSQIGYAYSDESKSSAPLAPLDGVKTKRDFIPYDIVVTKLD